MKDISIAKLHRLFLSSSGISIDTRKVQYGNIFFCLKGERFNANQFAQKALENGAIYVVIDEEEYYIDDRTILVSNVLEYLQQLAAFHRRQFNIPFIGITGTNGKTTTKELVNAVLSKGFKTHATKGNFNNHIGVPLTLLSLPKDTEIAIIEMGANHIGEIAELCKIAEPNYGIITSIGKAHLEGFGSIEGVIKTKTELYKSVEESAGTLFVNAEDNRLMELSEGVERRTYGKSSDADITFEENTNSAFASLIWQNLEISSQLVGGYNVDNMAAAIAIGDYFQIKPQQIALALREYVPENKRSQWLKTDKNEIVLDAYNANPSSMDVSLNSFMSIDHPNKWIILGDMLELGKDSQEEHSDILDKLADFDNKQILLVGPEFLKSNKEKRFHSFETTQGANEFILANPITNALILVKGSRGIALENLLDNL
jgi:UDP-N-acetylmuramoyl-tripeptide--D-alanyl-D-alanine ligase